MRSLAALALATALHLPHGYDAHVYATGLTHPTAFAFRAGGATRTALSSTVDATASSSPSTDVTISATGRIPSPPRWSSSSAAAGTSAGRDAGRALGFSSSSASAGV